MTAKPAFRDPNVLRWLGAYTTSVTGDVAYFMALSWATARVAGPAQVGVVLAVGAIPRAVLMLGGGVLADRFGPRRVLIGSDLVRCGVLLGAATATWAGGPQLWLLYALSVLFGVVDAVFMPAVGALPPRLTDQAQPARVQGMRVLAVRFSNAVGPLAGSFALVVAGPTGAFAVVGVLFGVSLGLLLVVRMTPVVATPVATASVEGDVEPAPPRHSSVESIPPRRLSADLRDGIRGIRAGTGGCAASSGSSLSVRCASAARSRPDSSFSPMNGSGTPPHSAGFSPRSASAEPSVPWRWPQSAGDHAPEPFWRSRSPPPPVWSRCWAGPPHQEQPLCSAGFSVASAVSRWFWATRCCRKRAEPRYLGRVTSVTTLGTLGLSPLLFPLTGLAAALWGTAAFFTGCGAVCLLAAATALSRPLRGASL